jgi:hypothetical protein
MFLALSFAVGTAFWVWRDFIPLLPVPALAGMGVAALTGTTHLFLPVLSVASSFAVFILGDARLPWLQGYNRLGDYLYGTHVYSLLIKQGVAGCGRVW